MEDIDNADELWQEVMFVDGFYQVSNYGRVKSYMLNSEGAFLNLIDRGGYRSFTAKIKGKKTAILVHRAVAEYFVPKPSKDHCVVIHFDHDPVNNYYKNLAWVTTKENFEHTANHNPEMGNIFRGGRDMKMFNCKLTKSDVEMIKSLINRGFPQRMMAVFFGVSEMQITRIKRGENWGDIKPKRERIVGKERLASSKSFRKRKIFTKST